ncbi:MAG: glycine/betaine ABC transporter substrate-binding protein, partial [Glaciimonas sp.]|nr:glycine/betaine ABC transporter substrate-binding protein [Glaciimonas sp.]
LGGFKLVQSSEAGMLSEVQRSARQKKWIVFWGWDPHPMNLQMKLTYLTGGDAIFGANFGEAKVFTLTANDYLERCPNSGKLINNLEFNTEMESHLMADIMDKTKPDEAAKKYLKKNPQVLNKWLDGVKTFDGKDGLTAVKTYLEKS